MLLENPDFKGFFATFPQHHATRGPPLCQTPEEGHRFSPHQGEHPAVSAGHTEDQIAAVFLVLHFLIITIIIIIHTLSYSVNRNSLHSLVDQCSEGGSQPKRRRSLSPEVHERIAAEVSFYFSQNKPLPTS